MFELIIIMLTFIYLSEKAKKHLISISMTPFMEGPYNRDYT